MGAKLDRLQALSRTHKVHHLHRNFRSPSYLLDLFNKFAVRELDADPALLPRADKITPKPKGALRLLAACDAKDQIELLSELALRAPEGETTAVLVPSNAMADTLSDRLKEQKVEHFKISNPEGRLSDGSVGAAHLAPHAKGHDVEAHPRLSRAQIPRLRSSSFGPASLFGGKSRRAQSSSSSTRKRRGSKWGSTT